MMSRYQKPDLECDLVMKGGITSGVIYPLAICALAQKYRFRSVGGASAGAIAATAAAAAECGRQRHLKAIAAARKTELPEPGRPPGSSFEGLETLPTEVGAPATPGGPSRLLSLFQPTPEGRPTLELALAWIGGGPLRSKLTRTLDALIHAAPGAFLLGIVLSGALLWAGSRADDASAWIAISIGIGAVWLVCLAVACAYFAASSSRALAPEHGYGLCPGFLPNERADAPGLTSWLSALLDRLAAQKAASGPLCVGDLTEHGIDLLTMTTNVTHGRPYRLPLENAGEWFFKRSEFERLFPKPVVEFMAERAHARLSKSADDELKWLSRQVNASGDDFILFPSREDLPVVVAARMSLSFPVLLQAVPLYAVDWTLRSNRDTEQPRLERCWFSDGGACSNLPLHFFDGLLPSRPTFALNLRGPHPDHPVQLPPFTPGKSEADNVWLPERNNAGIAERWNRFDRLKARVPLLGFLGALLDTMQSWNDQLTSKYPGYRDRVVHINHTPDEGGLNLTMEKDTIERLAARGGAAGEMLKRRFDPATGKGWDNHLWVRYRVLLSALSREAHAFESLKSSGQANRLGELVNAPPSYRMTASQKAAALRVSEALVELAQALRQAQPQFDREPPRPHAELKARPNSG